MTSVVSVSGALSIHSVHTYRSRNKPKIIQNSFYQLVLQVASLKLSILFSSFACLRFETAACLPSCKPLRRCPPSHSALTSKLRLCPQLAHRIADRCAKEEQQIANCLCFLPALPYPIALPILRKSCGGAPQPRCISTAQAWRMQTVLVLCGAAPRGQSARSLPRRLWETYFSAQQNVNFLGL